MDISRNIDIFHRDAASIAPGQHLLFYPIAVDAVDGDIVTDIDGNQYIDFLSSASSMNLGGSHPAIIHAVKLQMGKCTQYCTCYTLNRPMVEYGERLTSIYPGGIPVKIFFSHSGSDAMDMAFRYVKAYTRRTHIICFEHSYHGSTYAASNLSDICGGRFLEMPDIHRFRYFYEGETTPPGNNYMYEIEQAFATEFLPEDTAAVFIEPIQGDGGMQPAAREFICQLHKMCQKYGILFISDEVQQGFFRSGRWFSIEHYGVIPDGIVLGKSVGAGFPLGAFMARKEILESLPASLCASTMAGYHLACAAGSAQFDYMCRDDFKVMLDERSRLFAKLAGDLERHCDRNVRLKVSGTGLSCGVHILNREKGLPDPFTAYKIAFRCYEKGLLLITVAGNVLRLQPPLTVSEAHLVRGFELLEGAMEDIASGYESDDMLRFYEYGFQNTVL